jgi:sphingomyelin phosphodiesterase
LTDLHIDFYYKEGASNECNFPICCRDNGPELVEYLGSPTAGKAGKWGDYKCDIPVRTLESMFEYIGDNQKELKTDFITWTGDNSAHNVWSNNDDEVTEYTSKITDMLNEALGPDSEIAIFPAMGNHDTWPVNV